MDSSTSVIPWSAVCVDNDLPFVRRVVADLEGAGVLTWLFGGWAEELIGLCLPRPHHDVDLLYPAQGFGVVDAFLAQRTVDEITAKRFPHKRAFEADGIMVELFLVQGAESRYYTDFWGLTRHDWPDNVLGVQAGGLRVASAMALVDYRAKHTNYQPSIGGRPATAEQWLQHRGGSTQEDHSRDGRSRA